MKLNVIHPFFVGYALTIYLVKAEPECDFSTCYFPYSHVEVLPVAQVITGISHRHRWPAIMVSLTMLHCVCAVPAMASPNVCRQ